MCRNTLGMSGAWLCFLLVVLIEPRALHSLGKWSVMDLHPSCKGMRVKGVSDVRVDSAEPFCLLLGNEYRMRGHWRASSFFSEVVNRRGHLGRGREPGNPDGASRSFLLGGGPSKGYLTTGEPVTDREPPKLVPPKPSSMSMPSVCFDMGDTGFAYD